MTKLHVLISATSRWRQFEWFPHLGAICEVFDFVHIRRTSCWEDQVNIDVAVKLIKAYGSEVVAMNSLWVVSVEELLPGEDATTLLDPKRVWEPEHYRMAAEAAINQAKRLGCLSSLGCEPEGASEKPNASGKSIKRTCEGEHQEAILARINAAATQPPDNRVDWLKQDFGATSPKRPMYQWINLGTRHSNSATYFHSGNKRILNRARPHAVYDGFDKGKILPWVWVSTDGADFKGQPTFSPRQARALTVHGLPELGYYIPADDLIEVVTELARLKETTG